MPTFTLTAYHQAVLQEHREYGGDFKFMSQESPELSRDIAEPRFKSAGPAVSETLNLEDEAPSAPRGPFHLHPRRGYPINLDPMTVTRQPSTGDGSSSDTRLREILDTTSGTKASYLNQEFCTRQGGTCQV